MNISHMKSPDKQSDEQLLALIGVKDKSALHELYERYRQPLGSFLNRKIYANKLVDEAFNDVMFTVWRKAHDFRGDSKASTWIFGIAYRVAMNTARKESKHTDNRSGSDPEELDIAAEVKHSNDVSDELKLAIDALKENHKIVIELAYFHDKSLSEIAIIIGIPINTVKTRLFHARQYLKKYLEAATLDTSTQ